MSRILAMRFDSVRNALVALLDGAGGTRSVDIALTQVPYVGTNPEAAGTTPFQLTKDHKRVQVLNPAGAITVKLPTTGIKAGEVVRIVNRSVNVITLQSSGANTVATIATGYVDVVAVVNVPTAAADWVVASVAGTATNDAAAAGIPGEYLSQSRTSPGLTRTTGQSGTAFDVTATPLTLTPGDWDLFAMVSCEDAAAGTTITNMPIGVSLTSATLPGNTTRAAPNASGECRGAFAAPATPAGGSPIVTLPGYRVSLSVSTIFYLVCQPTFATNSLGVWGTIAARRRR